jgi:hypothetical protein
MQRPARGYEPDNETAHRAQSSAHMKADDMIQKELEWSDDVHAMIQGVPDRHSLMKLVLLRLNLPDDVQTAV